MAFTPFKMKALTSARFVQLPETPIEPNEIVERLMDEQLTRQADNEVNIRINDADASQKIREGLRQRIGRFFTGDDVFISYARLDGARYALNLGIALNEKKLSCYLDQWGTSTGKKLPLKLRLALRRSTMLVLLGSTQATMSEAVLEEVREFLKTGRYIIPVSFNGSLENATWYEEIAGAMLSMETAEALKTGQPSPYIVARIFNAEGFVSRNERLRRFVKWASLGITILILFGAGLGYYLTALARAERDRQVKISSTFELANKAEASRLERGNLLELSSLLAVESLTRFGELSVDPPFTARQTLRLGLTSLARHIATLPHDGGVTDVAATRDGRYLATAWRDENAEPHGVISFWECGRDGCKLTGRHLRTGYVQDAAFSPDGKYLAAASHDGLRVWEWGRESTAPVWGETGENSGYRAVTFSADGRYLAAGVGNIARIWKWNGPKTDRLYLRELTHRSDPKQSEQFMMDLAFSPDGEFLLTAYQRMISAWRTGSKGTPVWTSEMDTQAWAVVFSPDGRYLAAGDMGLARVWKWAGTQTREEFTRITQQDGISSLAFSADGAYLAIGGVAHTARIWHCESTISREVSRVVHHDLVQGVAFLGPEDRRLVTVSEDRTARISEWYKEPDTAGTVNIEAISQAIITLSPNGMYCAAGRCGESDKTCRIWQVLETGAGSVIGRQFIIEDGYGQIVALSPDGKYFLVSKGEGDLQAFDTAEGRVIWEPDGSGTVGDALAFSPDGKHLAFLNRNPQPDNPQVSEPEIYVWKWAGGNTEKSPQVIRKLRTNLAERILSMALNRDGKFIAVASVTSDSNYPETTIKVFEVDSGRLIGAPRLHEMADQKLASVTLEDSQGYNGHDVIVLSFAPDSDYLAVGSMDTLELWGLNIARTEWITNMRVKHRSDISGIGFSDDGKFLKTLTSEGVQSWLWRREDLIAEVCNRVSRNLTK